MEEDSRRFGQPPVPFGEPGLVPKRELEAQLVPQTVKVEALRDDHLIGASTPAHFAPAASERPLRPDRNRRDGRAASSRRHVQRLELRARADPGRAGSLEAGLPASDSRGRRVPRGGPPRLPGSVRRPDRKRDLDFLFTKSTHADELRPYRPLYALAERVAGGAKSPYAAAVALERWFRVGGGFLYDQHPPHTPGVPPLVDFVTRTHQGYCQHFAGAMALMLRYLGDPVEGRGRASRAVATTRHGEWVVSDRDAHAWVEVWFRGWGWLPFDPTPGGGGLDGPYSSSSSTFNVAAAAAVLAGPGDREVRQHCATSSASAPAAPSPDVPSSGARGRRLVDDALGAPGGSCACSPRARRALALSCAAKLVVRRSRYLTRDPRRLAAACRRSSRLPARPAHRCPGERDARASWRRSSTEFGSTPRVRAHADAPASARRCARGRARARATCAARAACAELSRERMRGLLSLRSLGFAGCSGRHGRREGRACGRSPSAGPSRSSDRRATGDRDASARARGRGFACGRRHRLPREQVEQLLGDGALRARASATGGSRSRRGSADAVRAAPLEAGARPAVRSVSAADTLFRPGDLRRFAKPSTGSTASPRRCAYAGRTRARGAALGL